jgi:hypothetical protein
MSSCRAFRYWLLLAVWVSGLRRKSRTISSSPLPRVALLQQRADYITFWKFFVKIFFTLANKKRRGVLQIGNKYLLLAKGESLQPAWILALSFGVATLLRE